MTAAHDAVGHETLGRISTSLDAYNRLMFEQVSPWVGDAVLEIGSGIGNLSTFLVDRPRVTLTDVSGEYLDILLRRFGDRPGVSIAHWDLGVDPPDALARERFDTIVCFNVLEHVEDDHAALLRASRLLAPSGTLALLVPAHQVLYNGLDRALGHFRRYDKASLSTALGRAGFHVDRVWYFNALGTLGWFVNGTLLRRTLLPEGQMRIFDRFVPLLGIERLIPPPFGLSVIAVARVAAQTHRNGTDQPQRHKGHEG